MLLKTVAKKKNSIINIIEFKLFYIYISIRRKLAVQNLRSTYTLEKISIILRTRLLIHYLSYFFSITTSIKQELLPVARFLQLLKKLLYFF